MKNSKYENYFYWGITIFCVLTAILLLFFAFYRWDYIFAGIGSVISILMPIIFGLAIAYVMNPVVKWLENKIFNPLLKKLFKGKFKNKKKLSRGLALCTSTLIFWGLLITCLSFLFPEMIKSLQVLFSNMNTYINNAEEFLFKFIGQNEEMSEYVNDFFSKFSDNLTNWLNAGGIDGVISTLSSGIFGTLKFLYNMIIGYIISIYVLFDKEKFKAQAKKLLYTFFDNEKINIIVENARYTDKVFGGFFAGKLIDSLIIGLICFAFMFILDWPYALIVSVIIGVTNIIPYFGPFIGAIPSAFLIFLVDPGTSLQFLIFIFILQQIDGNIIGPKILGGKTGLSSFWVLCSLLIFGGLFGVIGMILGVPIFSILYSFVNGLVKKKLEDKHLPLDSKDYEKLLYVDEKTGKPVYQK